jgi:hypothetical protein
MKYRGLAALLVVCTYLVILPACGPLLAGKTHRPGKPSPPPCVTATPVADGIESATSVSGAPAGQSTPASGAGYPQPTGLAQELEKRETQLSRQNLPVEVPAAEGPATPTVPVCPTPTPTK